MEKFKKIISACFEKGFSDLHIAGNHPLVCRKDGRIHFQKEFMVGPEYIDDLVGKLLNARQLERLKNRWSADLAVTIAGNRLRVNVFSSVRGLSLAIRFLPGRTPTVELLNLHPCVKDFCAEPAGLVLVCGPTGCGKTTTIASLVNEINQARPAHVITLEDPIEYVFNSKTAFIEQRELGKHFHTFADGLMDILREAPDVVVVGEMRRPDTIRLALDAAESGHLVISTMHAGSPEEAVYRICNSFPYESQEFVRRQLSSCLAGVIVQQLRFMPRLGFSVPRLCMMRSVKAARNIIRENKLAQLEGLIETSRERGMFSFERYQSDFLDGKKDFSVPAKALYPTGKNDFPQEYLSARLNYGADFSLERETAACANGAEAPPAGSGGLVDEYILRLEGKS